MRYFRAIFILPILLPLGFFVGIFWAFAVATAKDPVELLKEIVYG
jgi:hypothetical protein